MVFLGLLPLLLCLRVIFFALETTPQTTSPSGCDKPNLLPCRRVSSHCCWETHMLMVPSSVWMVNWAHSNTTHKGPAVPFGFEPVVAVARFENWLLNAPTTSDDPHHCTTSAGHGLLLS
eukprot:TRINITY_DN328_c0_g1_i1.p2 TRINITY_DN328_c0_g1~~TRINITY_DN328_c0_g1_i1.p2  ORF type:complete len:128 (-),score=0.32 TRINITY_DN328_c0_g1_i1:490-846(-)